jgi:hypothetical protein
MRFMALDFSGLSFRNCDLTDVTFSNSNLANAHFQGARFAGTRFIDIPEGGLRGAQFGELEHFDYFFAGQRAIDERDKARDWLLEMTGTQQIVAEPCPTALQVRFLFQKFVRPDGTGRRNELTKNALLRGKKFTGAPSPEDCLLGALRCGYVTGPDYRDRFRRVTGLRYEEMVAFVKEWRLSETMQEYLDSYCPIRNCPHVPPSHAG